MNTRTDPAERGTTNLATERARRGSAQLSGCPGTARSDEAQTRLGTLPLMVRTKRIAL